jgi:hypothetical protein
MRIEQVYKSSIYVKPEAKVLWERLLHHVPYSADTPLRREALIWHIFTALSSWANATLPIALSELWVQEREDSLLSVTKLPAAMEWTMYTPINIGKYQTLAPRVANRRDLQAWNDHMINSLAAEEAEEILQACTKVLNSPETLLMFKLQQGIRDFTRKNLTLVSRYFTECAQENIANSNRPPKAMCNFLSFTFREMLALILNQDAPMSTYHTWLLSQADYPAAREAILNIKNLLHENNKSEDFANQLFEILREELATEQSLMQTRIVLSTLSLGMAGRDESELLDVKPDVFKKDHAQIHGVNVNKPLHGCTGSSETPALLTGYFEALQQSKFAKDYRKVILAGRQYAIAKCSLGDFTLDTAPARRLALINLIFSTFHPSRGARPLRVARAHPWQEIGQQAHLREGGAIELQLDGNGKVLLRSSLVDLMANVAEHALYSATMLEAIKENILYYQLGEALNARSES